VKDTRNQILDAAKRVITQKGFHGSTMEDIAKAAGVAKGTSYLYFKSKIELYLAVMEREFDYITSCFEEIIKSRIPVLKKIEGIISFFIEYMKENRDFVFSLMYEPPLIKMNKDVIHKRYRNKIDNIRHKFIEVLEEGIRRGDIIKEDPEVLADVIFGAIVRPVIQFVIRKKTGDIDSLKFKIMNILTKGIVRKGG